MRIAIYKENMAVLYKELAKAEDLCPNTVFFCEKIGEQTRFLKNNFKKQPREYAIVEVTACQKNSSWQIVAAFLSNGNRKKTLRQFDTRLPENLKSKISGTTLVIRNIENGDFQEIREKKISDFFPDLTLEEVLRIADFCDFIRDLERTPPVKGDQVSECYDTQEILRYAAELHRVESYVARHYSDYSAKRYDSKTKVLEYRDILHKNTANMSKDHLKEMKDMMALEKFNPDSEEAALKAQKVTDWIKENESDSEYIQDNKRGASYIQCARG